MVNERHPATRGLLADKHVVIAGLSSRRSLAAGIASAAKQAGAELVLLATPRSLHRAHRVNTALGLDAEVLAFDVTNSQHVDGLLRKILHQRNRIDGLVHAIASAPPSCIGGAFSRAQWDDVAATLQASTYSLAALTRALRPIMRDGGSIVALHFDSTRAIPEYNWMGVAKEALASVARYLARDLGANSIRVNLVASGPVATPAASAFGVGGSESWARRAPLGWQAHDHSPIALACVVLLSDLLSATTGEVIHVDGGHHCVDGA